MIGEGAAAAAAGAGGVPDIRNTAFLRSDRLSLWPLSTRDARSLLEMDRSDLVARWLLDDRLQNLMQAYLLIDWMRAFYERCPGLGAWAARDGEDRFVGIYSLMPVEDSDDIEIGARLLPEFWNGGLAVEMGWHLCRHAFVDLALPRLISLCDPRHLSVPSVLARLGFQATGATVHFGKPALGFVQYRDAWMQGGQPAPNP